MMRRDNPKILKLQAERSKTQTRLDMLCKGIGHSLADFSYREGEQVRELIDLVNTELVPAVKAAEAANKAYQPYWGRRRRRVYRPRRKRKKAPNTANGTPKARKRRAGGKP